MPLPWLPVYEPLSSFCGHSARCGLLHLLLNVRPLSDCRVSPTWTFDPDGKSERGHHIAPSPTYRRGAAKSSRSLNKNVEDRTPTSSPSIPPVSESSWYSYNLAQEFGKSEQQMRNPHHHQNKMESFLEPSTAVARLLSPGLRATPGTPHVGSAAPRRRCSSPAGRARAAPGRAGLRKPGKTELHTAPRRSETNMTAVAWSSALSRSRDKKI